MSDHVLNLNSDSPEATEAIGAALYRSVSPGTCIALFGDLGAGKTCLTRGITHANNPDAQVSSPTFTLVNEYPGVSKIYHMDLYRLGSLDELFDIGLDELMTPEQGICVMEWAERAEKILPQRRIEVHLSHDGQDNRKVEIKSYDVLSSRELESIENSSI